MKGLSPRKENSKKEKENYGEEPFKTLKFILQVYLTLAKVPGVASGKKYFEKKIIRKKSNFFSP